MNRRWIASLTALAVVVPAAPALAGNGKPDDRSASPLDLAIIGDTPYGPSKLAALPAQIDQINSDPKVRVVLHLGDIKSGSTRCDTGYFEQIRADFDRFADPLIYTPGDNEWTDCHRANNGGYQPAGPRVQGPPVTGEGPSRLDEIRRIFFDRPGESLGRRSRAVESQGAPIVENVRWSESRTVFGTLNIPGSDNDLLPWFGAAETDALKRIQADEFATRNAADLAWLDHIFDVAQSSGSRAVVIGIQADVWDPAIEGDPAQYSGFREFVGRLAARTRAFGGPVLLLNGDSHAYEADRPLADPNATNAKIYGVTEPVSNLQRITVDGSAAANDYLRLHIDPRSAGVFSFERVPYTTPG